MDRRGRVTVQASPMSTVTRRLENDYTVEVLSKECEV